MSCNQIKVATILKIEVSKRSILKRDNYFNEFDEIDGSKVQLNFLFSIKRPKICVTSLI